MPKFAYEARNEDGQLTGGLIAAESLEHAGQLLSERNLFVVRLGSDDEADTARRGSRVKGGATRAEVAWCMSQLAIMVGTGMQLSEALDCLARQTSQIRLKTMLERISQTVQEGQSLSVAMSMYPKAFPLSLTAMIRASEMSGTMTHVLQRSASYLVEEMKIRKRIRGAIMYPAFMFLLCIGITIFLLTVILPRFAEIFAGRGATLPLPTRILMGISDSLVATWYLWVIGVIVLSVGGYIWARTRIGRKQIDYLVLNVPILSTVFNKLYQLRSFRAMALLLDAGVTLVDAMKILQSVVPNSYYCELWQEVDRQIRDGEHLSGPLLESELIPEPIAQMIAIGERSGRLGQVFGNLADFIEEEYNQSIHTATQFIEPCMILVMGSIIGLVAASLLLPLFQAGQVMTQ